MALRPLKTKTSQYRSSRKAQSLFFDPLHLSSVTRESDSHTLVCRRRGYAVTTPKLRRLSTGPRQRDQAGEVVPKGSMITARTKRIPEQQGDGDSGKTGETLGLGTSPDKDGGCLILLHQRQPIREPRFYRNDGSQRWIEGFLNNSEDALLLREKSISTREIGLR